MSSSPGDSTTSQSHGSSTSSDSACFECNICFDLAQDPIVTLCGHLFCWPCLYKWLHVHSHSQECPVCKAIIEEEKLVPLYGRGKTSSDPRSRSMPDEDIPHRPTGQRPETASQANLNQIPQPQGFGIMGGFPPMATARWGNFMFSTGFGGLFPSLFNFHVHGFRGAAGYGPHPSFPYTFHGGHAHGFPHQHHHHHHHHNAFGQQADSNLAMLFAIVGVLVIVALLWF